MKLMTKNLVISPLISEDAESFYYLTQNQGFRRFQISNYKMPSISAAQNWIEEKSKELTPRKLGFYGIRKDGHLIGICAHKFFDVKKNEIEIMYRLHSDFWGHGYGSETATALMNFGKEELKLGKIVATVDPNNIHSKKILKQAGFHFEKLVTIEEQVEEFWVSADYKIRLANDAEGPLLTDLALRSKSHWDYDQEYLKQCRPAMTVNEQYINDWTVMVLEDKAKIIGFYALKFVSGENRLDHLWLDLPYIGKGYGRILLEHSFVKAKELGWNSYRLATDKGAITFYEKFGAKKIGLVQSRIRPDLYLEHLEFTF